MVAAGEFLADSLPSLAAADVDGGLDDDDDVDDVDKEDTPEVVLPDSHVDSRSLMHVTST